MKEIPLIVFGIIGLLWVICIGRGIFRVIKYWYERRFYPQRNIAIIIIAVIILQAFLYYVIIALQYEDNINYEKYWNIIDDTTTSSTTTTRMPPPPGPPGLPLLRDGSSMDTDEIKAGIRDRMILIDELGYTNEVNMTIIDYFREILLLLSVVLFEMQIRSVNDAFRHNKKLRLNSLEYFKSGNYNIDGQEFKKSLLRYILLPMWVVWSIIYAGVIFGSFGILNNKEHKQLRHIFAEIHVILSGILLVNAFIITLNKLEEIYKIYQRGIILILVLKIISFIFYGTLFASQYVTMYDTQKIGNEIIGHLCYMGINGIILFYCVSTTIVFSKQSTIKNHRNILWVHYISKNKDKFDKFELYLYDELKLDIFGCFLELFQLGKCLMDNYSVLLRKYPRFIRTLKIKYIKNIVLPQYISETLLITDLKKDLKTLKNIDEEFIYIKNSIQNIIDKYNKGTSHTLLSKNTQQFMINLNFSRNAIDILSDIIPTQFMPLFNNITINEEKALRISLTLRIIEDVCKELFRKIQNTFNDFCEKQNKSINIEITKINNRSMTIKKDKTELNEDDDIDLEKIDSNIIDIDVESGDITEYIEI